MGEHTVDVSTSGTHGGYLFMEFDLLPGFLASTENHQLSGVFLFVNRLKVGNPIGFTFFHDTKFTSKTSPSKCSSFPSTNAFDGFETFKEGDEDEFVPTTVSTGDVTYHIYYVPLPSPYTIGVPPSEISSFVSKLTIVIGVVDASTSSAESLTTSTDTSGPLGGIGIQFDYYIPNPCGKRGAVCKDPHFVGYDGSVYDFHGVSGGTFALISDSMFQVNALFRGRTEHELIKVSKSHTWILELGVVCANNTVLISHPEEFNVAIENRKGSPLLVDIDHKKLSAHIQCGAQWNVTVTSEYDKETEGYNFRLESSALQIPANPPHGVLGQTLAFEYKGDRIPHPVKGEGDQGKGVVEGAVKDYMVHDGILGHDFTFSRYTGVAEKSRVGTNKVHQGIAFHAAKA